MSVFDIFSKRQKRLRGELPDVFVYDRVPEPLRVQIVHIWNDTLGTADYCSRITNVRDAYGLIVTALRREYGVFRLYESQNFVDAAPYSELIGFLLSERNTERVIDVIETSFRVIDKKTRTVNYLHLSDGNDRADEAITELNARFREHGVGYEFSNGSIIRVDSEYLHADVVKPALALLTSPGFKGAQAEFLAAHEHYRHNRMKEALADCLKAFESTMKIICAKRKWHHDPGATAKPLLDTLFTNGLIPPFWQQHFSGLRAALEAGVPVARNRLSGHGQGTQVVQVPEYLGRQVLHLTAAAIVFLAEADNALP